MDAAEIITFCKKAFSTLNLIARESTLDTERTPAVSGFVSMWKKYIAKWKEEDQQKALEEFIKGFEAEAVSQSENAQDILGKAAQYVREALPDLFTAIETRYQAEADAAERITRGTVLNDVCAMLYQAEQLRAANQNSTARTFETEAQNLLESHSLTREDLRAYRTERKKALIQLFEKAELIAAVTNATLKEKYETEFATLAIEYGFLTAERTGTTEEFNAEYTKYLVDREAYTNPPRKQSKSGGPTAAAAAAMADAATNSDDEEAPSFSAAALDEEDEVTVPQGPLEFHLHPIRDATGEIQGITPAQNYGEALQTFLGNKADKVSLSVDFLSEKVELTAKQVALVQHADMEEWQIVAETLSWKTGNPTAPVRGLKMKISKEGKIALNGLTAAEVEIKGGELSLREVEKSAITLGNGAKLQVSGVSDNLTLIGEASGNYELGEIIDTTIKMAGDIKVGKNSDSAIELGGKSTFSSQGESRNLTLTAGKGSILRFSQNLDGGNISAKGSIIELTSKAVSAQGVRFVGTMPHSPALVLPEDTTKPKRDVAAEKLLKMEYILHAGFGLATPGQLKEKGAYSKLGEAGKSKALSGPEGDFVDDLLSAFAQGYRGHLLKITMPDDFLEKWEAKKEEYKAKGQLIIVPIFPDKADAGKEGQKPEDIKGKFHYRCMLLLSSGDHLYHYGRSYPFKNPKSKTGYNQDYFQELARKCEHILFDLECTASVKPDLSILSQSKTGLLSRKKAMPAIPETVRNALVQTTLWEEAQEKKPEPLFKTVRRNRAWNYAYYSSDPIERRYTERDTSHTACKDMGDLTAWLVGNNEGPPPVLLSASVYTDCTFASLRGNFIAENMGTNSFDAVDATAIVLGDMTRTCYLNNTQIAFSLLGSADFTGAAINKSKISLVKEDRPDRKQYIGNVFDLTQALKAKKMIINFEGAEIEDGELTIALDSGDELNAKNIKGKNAKITVTGAGKVDFEGAKFENCTVTVKDAKSLNLKNTEHLATKLKITADKIEAEGIILTGKSTISGTGARADFTGAVLGTPVNEGLAQLHFSLQAGSYALSGCRLGNIKFDDAVQLDPAETDWSTVSVVGNIVARLTTARVLYPLFGKAANLARELPPAESAGKKAHPARVFSL